MIPKYDVEIVIFEKETGQHDIQNYEDINKEDFEEIYGDVHGEIVRLEMILRDEHL